MAHERILKRFQDCVRNAAYVLTAHAAEEMTADGYGVLDVESGVLTGMIAEKEKDEKTGESKYRVRGTASSGRGNRTGCKIGRDS